MVGESPKMYNLSEILSEKQVAIILRKALGNDHWKLVLSEFKSMSDGIAGFMGDHIKGALYVEVDGQATTVHLFIKRLPTDNKAKTDFIADNYFNKRERLLFSLVEEFEQSDSNPCLPKAYIYTDSIIVLPDLTLQGYATRHYSDTLDLPHVLVTAATLARFHAGYANYQTKKSADGVPYNILNDYGDIMEEQLFKESPWLQEAAQLTTNFLATFSSKYKNINVESLYSLYKNACDSLKDYEGTVNVLLHKDLWMNNIMFKYKNGVPVNAMLVDFQCIKYGPPTFDLMIFLYMTTSTSFREKYEKDVVLHYYKIFCDSLHDDTKARVTRLGYDKQEFLDWCDRSRMFGMLQAIAFFPFVLMDPKTAEKTYNDPETYTKNIFDDRSEPVIAYARKFATYRETQLEVCEEFIERYMLKDRPKLISKD